MIRGAIRGIRSYAKLVLFRRNRGLEAPIVRVAAETALPATATAEQRV